jgi:hypothetical protein
MHRPAYLLMVVLVLSTGMMFPYISLYLVFNTGRTAEDLPAVYFFGGLLTLLTMTPIGRLADRIGKLLVFRVLALATIVPILLITNLPPVPLVLALAATTLLFIVASGRMVPGMALITSSSLPRYRGSFLSVNSSVQLLALAVANNIGGAILVQTEKEPDRTHLIAKAIAGQGLVSPANTSARLPQAVVALRVAAVDVFPLEKGPLTGFPTLGLLGTVCAILSVVIAGRLRSPDLASELAASGETCLASSSGGSETGIRTLPAGSETALATAPDPS